jgi:ribosome recycling factor
MPVNKLISESEDKMSKAVDFLHDELRSLRTGRASTGLVENVKVDYYGTPTPLKTIAALSAPQADMIVVKPFDPASIKEIERAIRNSDLSIAPIVEGKLIRLNVPLLSEERRRQLVGQAKQLGEQAKVGIRNIRREANKQLEKQQKDKVVTEDDLQTGKKQVDDITKKYADKVDMIIKNKSDEIMLD